MKRSVKVLSLVLVIIISLSIPAFASGSSSANIVSYGYNQSGDYIVVVEVEGCSISGAVWDNVNTAYSSINIINYNKAQYVYNFGKPSHDLHFFTIFLSNNTYIQADFIT